MTKLHDLANLGQSIWLDYIRRSFMDSGQLQALVDQGVRGLTSNPSIFERAIAGSSDYDEQLCQVTDDDAAPKDIYEALAIRDIQRAADTLRPVYDESGGADGFVSLEADPNLAHDSAGTISEVRRLHDAVDRPNVMIKVPATQEGLRAIESLIADGININVTLLFAVDRYEAVARAYMAGLSRLISRGGDPSQVASVASFFVSRVDTAVDEKLKALGDAGSPLLGQIAIANAKVAYARFQELLASQEWKELADQGAHPQRLLWGSTSTKNPAYSDVKYVGGLVGEYTVNTVPRATLRAFMDHGVPEPALDKDLPVARSHLARLADLGIDLDAVTAELLDEGVDKFAKSFDDLLDAIESKRQRLAADWDGLTLSLGDYQETVDRAVAEMTEEQIPDRIWQHDHTVWKPDPQEIANRLGWLNVADSMLEQLPQLSALVESARSDGFTDVVLLGMGGSSLAPRVYAEVFGGQEGYLDLTVVDSTDPDFLAAEAAKLKAARTLFIVSSKSGNTVETLSFFRFFHEWLDSQLELYQESGDAGQHFVAITDPGTHLEDLARRYHFRQVFLNDPNIGGRYSALSYFGLVPAALVGVDVERLLRRAMIMATACESCVEPARNPAMRLGAALAELARMGRDKVTFVSTSQVAPFEDWVEQLMAESTGKEGTGIVPVVHEPLGLVRAYGEDRTFVYLRLATEDVEPQEHMVRRYQEAGFPVIRLSLDDHYDLGGQFFLWELATAIAGHRLGINPFDQPNVEAAKERARQMVDRYQETGQLPVEEPLLVDQGLEVYGDASLTANGNDSIGSALDAFLKQAPEHAYVDIQAYLPSNAAVDAALRSIAARLRDKTHQATTVGYGPRYLHSTGQLHKGGPDSGVFIQITADAASQVAVPEMDGNGGPRLSFEVLEHAQALGDRQALLDAGRHVLRFHLGNDVPEGLRRLDDALA